MQIILTYSTNSTKFTSYAPVKQKLFFVQFITQQAIKLLLYT
jgi:hypothetical protein